MFKSYNLKLTALFARYLYQYKILNLPGLGTFTLDPSIPVPEANDRNQDFIQHIRFEQRSVAAPDEEFIEFIRTQTGKIRPLAESDLDSFLTDGKVLLNIGKPFYFEGIGSLQKNRAGMYEFTPGVPLTDRIEKYVEIKSVEHDEWQSTSAPDRQQGSDPGKVLLVLAVLLGLIIVVAGGYYLYQRNSAGTPPDTESISVSEDNIAIDSVLQNNNLQDSITPAPTPSAAVQASVPGTYRFVIETTANKTRALKRYNQLKSYMLDIQLDAATDSSLFKLYFTIPASAADTTHIKDSLKRMYSTRMVTIE